MKKKAMLKDFRMEIRKSPGRFISIMFIVLLGVAFFGVFLGKILHTFIIGTVEVDAAMFGRIIKPVSYLYSLLFTIAFSMIVNWVMYFKLKKINMVEALKSVE